MSTYDVYALIVEASFGLDIASVHNANPSVRISTVQADLSDTDGIPSVVFEGRTVFLRLETDIAVTIDSPLENTAVSITAPETESGRLRRRMYILGPILSYILELRGVIVLHGAAIQDSSGDVISFLSHSGGGKSNLALTAALSGGRILADDITALDVEPAMTVRPGPPQMRLWPEDIPESWGAPETFPRVHPAHFKRRVSLDALGLHSTQTGPLRCLYIPQRSSEARHTEFEALHPSDALIELVRHSFAASFVDVAGLQPQRLKKLGRIAETVPIRRMVYPEGKERLPEAWAAVAADYSALRHSALRL